MDQLIEIIRKRLVNRDDRWGTYHARKRGPEAGIVKPGTAPSPWVLRIVEKSGRTPPFYGPEQIIEHLQGVGFPTGSLAISLDDRCKWLAVDIDRHGDGVPPEAVLAARDEMVHLIRDVLGLEGVIEDSGGGGWHVWIILDKAVPASDAYAMVRYIHAAGEDAWRKHDPNPRIDRFPSSGSRFSSKGQMGGKWLRMPGRHHRRDHTSSVLLPDGQRRSGPDLWECFEHCAVANTAEKWAAALALLPKATLPAGRCRPPADAASPTNEIVKAPKPNPTANWSYADWTGEQLATTPLSRGERREREKVLVWTMHKAGEALPRIAEALHRLYTEASGASEDLAIPSERDKLISGVPDLIDRLTAGAPYRWASPEEYQRVRAILLGRVAGLEQRGVPGWSGKRFDRWLGGLVGYLRSRAKVGKYKYLAHTIIRAARTKLCPDAEYVLRDHGGGYRPVVLPLDFMRSARRHLPRPAKLAPGPVTAYVAYLYLLATTIIDETDQTAIKIVCPAKRGKSPWILDCRALPLIPESDLEQVA